MKLDFAAGPGTNGAGGILSAHFQNDHRNRDAYLIDPLALEILDGSLGEEDEISIPLHLFQ